MAPHDDRLDDGREATADEQEASSISRRDFLKTVGAAGAATTVVGASTAAAPVAQPAWASSPPSSADPPYTRIRQEVAENLVKRGIVGYADHLRIQPGETIRFMVSSERPRYRADIVRLIHGDPNPKGPGIKEVVVDTPANGDYAGQRQMLPLGSYAIVPDNAALRLSGSFTFTAWIAPTSQRGAGGFEGVEGILTKWAGGARGGYAIVIDESGRLALWLTDPSGRTEKLQAAAALRPWVPAIPGMNQRPQGVATVWYFVAVSFDAASGRVVLHQDPINEFPFDESRGTTERPTTIKSVAGHDAPLLMLRCGSRPGGRPGSTTASSIIHGCIAALEVRAAGSELDRADFALGTPPHTLVLASSSGHSDAYQHVVEQINTSNNAKPGGTQNPLVRADMVFLEYPNGGAVFSSSAIAWCGSLSYNNYTNNVLRITENVLRRFAADTPLPAPGGRQGGQEINK